MARGVIRAVGIAWFRREDWDSVKQLFVDADRLPATYDEWLRKTEKVAERVEAQRGIADKVYIKPAEFSAWCAVHALDIDARARTSYASWVVARRYGDMG